MAMQKLIAVAILALAMTAGAKAPVTDTFTLYPPTGTYPQFDTGYHSYTMASFDGGPLTTNTCGTNPDGSAATCGQVYHAAVNPGDAPTWDFNTPNQNLPGCIRLNSVVTPAAFDKNGPAYQTQTVDRTFACSGFDVETIAVTLYQKSWCRFTACFTVVERYPITGTVTAQAAE
jgi:hypothetical protein